MEAELFFVARFKRGDFLYLTHGPFLEWDEADNVCDKQTGHSCYSKVVKIQLPLVVVE